MEKTAAVAAAETAMTAALVEIETLNAHMSDAAFRSGYRCSCEAHFDAYERLAHASERRAAAMPKHRHSDACTVSGGCK